MPKKKNNRKKISNPSRRSAPQARQVGPDTFGKSNMAIAAILSLAAPVYKHRWNLKSDGIFNVHDTVTSFETMPIGKVEETLSHFNADSDTKAIMLAEHGWHFGLGQISFDRPAGLGALRARRYTFVHESGYNCLLVIFEDSDEMLFLENQKNRITTLANAIFSGRGPITVEERAWAYVSGFMKETVSLPEPLR